jgi:hypothetical protein
MEDNKMETQYKPKNAYGVRTGQDFFVFHGKHHDYSCGANSYIVPDCEEDEEKLSKLKFAPSEGSVLVVPVKVQYEVFDHTGYAPDPPEGGDMTDELARDMEDEAAAESAEKMTAQAAKPPRPPRKKKGKKGGK